MKTLPINLATEVLDDKWSLVILRDMMFGDRAAYEAEVVACDSAADRVGTFCDTPRK